MTIMLLCLLFVLLLPRIFDVVSSLVARRALPLVLGLTGAWIAHEIYLGWSAVVMTGLAVVSACALLLDYLTELPDMRRIVMTAEAIAGAGLSSFIGYALFGSLGVAGVTLLVSCAGLATITAIAALDARQAFAEGG